MLLTQQDGNDPMEGEPNTQGEDEPMLLTQQEGSIRVEDDPNTQYGEDMPLARQDNNDAMEGEPNTQEEDEAMLLTQQDGNTFLTSTMDTSRLSLEPCPKELWSLSNRYLQRLKILIQNASG